MRIAIALLMLAALTAGVTSAETVPGTTVARGTAIAEARLIAPTTRYDHFVRGNRAEGGGLLVRLRSGQTLTLMLGDDQVFEDSGVRLADFDGDGIEEIVVVLTSLKQGAALAIYEVRDGKLGLRARTPFIGQTHRWLNPAGIADFDGDGRLEVALVQMPHLAKRVELWRPQGQRITRVYAVEDVTNHRNGSVHTAMAATGDFNGDGITDLAIPDGARTTLRLLSFAGGVSRQIAAIALGGPADGDISARRGGSDWTFRIGLQSGGVATVRH